MIDALQPDAPAFTIAAAVRSGEVTVAAVIEAALARIDVAGITTSAGSAIYRDAQASARDADVVRALEAAGAVCVGALNMDEFGMGGTTENSCFGPTRNPHDLSRTPGVGNVNDLALTHGVLCGPTLMRILVASRPLRGDPDQCRRERHRQVALAADQAIRSLQMI